MSDLYKLKAIFLLMNKEKGMVKAYITERFPQADERHSYGCMLIALTEAYKNGITEIELDE